MVNEKHWTIELSESIFDQGFRYAIMKRTPQGINNNVTPKMLGFDNLEEFYNVFCLLNPNHKMYEKTRFAIIPLDKNKFNIMHYLDNGMYYVVGFIFKNKNIV